MRRGVVGRLTLGNGTTPSTTVGLLRSDIHDWLRSSRDEIQLGLGARGGSGLSLLVVERESVERDRGGRDGMGSGRERRGWGTVGIHTKRRKGVGGW